ncbi:hypothetical protein [Armatimonas sp.]|uniref:hypothetical protein n=1 Tax=Armatimonas sp. TaxID=1872638 RepID=UPI003753D55E
MRNEILFSTGGDWDSTSLMSNGYAIEAAQLYIELSAGRDDWGDEVQGGIWEGADLTAMIRPAEDPMAPIDIFPGRISMEFPGYTIVMENQHPMVDMRHLRVWLNGEDITDRVVDVVVDINAVDSFVQAYVSVYKSRFLLRDEVITHTII